MTPPSTQNLKALGLWVFFLICCSTSHWYTPPRAQANDPLLVPPFTHLYGTHLPKTSIKKTFDTGSNWAHSSGDKDEPSALIPLAGKIWGGNTEKISRELSHTTYNGMTPHSIQNLKALSLWVLFLICCSTSHWYTPPRAEANDPLLVSSFTHLYGTHLPETSIRKTFDTGSNWVHLSDDKDEPSALIPLGGKIRGGNTEKISNNENWVIPHIREWHHLQPKTLRHWVCGSSFLYVAQLHTNTLPLERKRTTPCLYSRSHTYTGHTCLKPLSRRLSIQGQTEPIRPVTKTNHRLWYHIMKNKEINKDKQKGT